MKRLISVVFILVSTLCVAQTRIYRDLQSDYYRIYKFNTIEITPLSTVAEVTLKYYPNYWVCLNSTSYLKESNGNRKYKLLKVDGFPMDERKFVPSSGRVEIKMYFEPIDVDVTSLDFIEPEDTPISHTFGIRLTDKASDANKQLPFVGQWIATDGSNRWAYGFYDKVAVMDNQVWDYVSVNKKGGFTQVVLDNKGRHAMLYIKSLKSGNLLIGRDNNRLLKEFGPQFVRNNTAKTGWTFDVQYNKDSVFKSGKAVICGYFDHYSPKLGFTNSLIHTEESILCAANACLVNIEPDGRFYGEVNLEYPVHGYFEVARQNVYLSPADTIFMYSDLLEANDPKNLLNRGGESAMFMSNNRSTAQINNFGKEIKELLLPGLDGVAPHKDVKNGVDTIFACRDKMLCAMESVQRSAGEVFDRYDLTPYAKNLLMTSMLIDNMTYIFDLELYHSFSKVKHDVDSLGRNIEVPNKDFVPLDTKRYYDFISRVWSQIFDNPLSLSCNNSSVFMNRIEFAAMANQYQARNSVLAERGMRGVPPDLMFEQALGAKSFDTWQSYGLEKCMVYDYILARNIAYSIKFGAENSDKSWFIDMVSAKLPYISTPYVTKKVVQLYADHALSNAKSVAVQQRTEPDSVLERIIAPYKGNVLYLDFWSTGCGPCRGGMIEAKKMVDELKNNKIKFLYITNEAQSPIKEFDKFLSENAIKGEHIRVDKDTWNRLSVSLKIRGIPHYTVIDKTGKIVKNKIASSKKELLELEQE